MGNSQMDPKIFFIFSANFISFFRYETIETHALTFLIHIILVIGGVTTKTVNNKIGKQYYFSL